MAKALRRDREGKEDVVDRSLSKALSVLKRMKTDCPTWLEMAQRVEREFGAQLDKDQLKALVR
jgi:hypothetical protein